LKDADRYNIQDRLIPMAARQRPAVRINHL